jgi:hypothetical protein
VSFDSVLKVANAVLYEGYMLYPYRASAAKNQFRWQFGVVAPRGFSELTDVDSWQMQTECLLEPFASAELRLRLRFLHLEARSVERCAGDGVFEPVETLEVDGRQHIAWDEGDEQEIDATFALSELLEGERSLPIDLAAALRDEPILDAAGNLAGRYLREKRPIRAVLTVHAETLVAPSPLLKISARLENLTPWPEGNDNREDTLRQSLIAAHTLLWAPGAEFVSLTEPPEWARHQVAGCTNVHTWPVLAGEEDRRDLVLSSPIILYDHPQIAPESPNDFFDATEIDEMLALRTMTLTDAEKQEACLTDPRAAAIIEQMDALPPELMDRLHGAVRYLREIHGRRPEEQALEQEALPEQEVVIGGKRVRPGDAVRIRSGLRASDAQDIFLEGRCATVEKVVRDAEDRVYLAVTLADDPGADLHRWHGRFLYFEPHELETVEEVS